MFLYDIWRLDNVGADPIRGLWSIPPIEPDVRGPSGGSKTLQFLVLIDWCIVLRADFVNSSKW